MRASEVVANRLRSYSTCAQLLCGMWNLPGPGIEPMSLALTGIFFPLSHQGNLHCFDLRYFISFKNCFKKLTIKHSLFNLRDFFCLLGSLLKVKDEKSIPAENLCRCSVLSQN